MADAGLSSSAPAPPVPQQQQQQQQRLVKRVEYYAEDSFKGANLIRTVHLGWGAAIGSGLILFCMGMSAITGRRSWNVSFQWLQRRVGAQFGTMSYVITSNFLYYHDGDKWVTRPWAHVFDRYKDKGDVMAAGPTFASGAA